MIQSVTTYDRDVQTDELITGLGEGTTTADQSEANDSFFLSPPRQKLLSPSFPSLLSPVALSLPVQKMAEIKSQKQGFFASRV